MHLEIDVLDLLEQLLVLLDLLEAVVLFLLELVLLHHLFDRLLLVIAEFEESCVLFVQVVEGGLVVFLLPLE